MKGTLRLIHNELTKVFHQLSWKIITIIILALSLLNPVLSHVFMKYVYVSDNSYYYEMYESAEDGTIEKEYYGVMVECDKFFDDNGIDSDDWRNEMYRLEYEDALSELRSLELIKNGRDPEEVMSYMWCNNITLEYGVENSVTVMYYDDSTGEFVKLDRDVAASEYDNAKLRLDELGEHIKNVTIRSYAEGQISELKKSIENREEYHKEAKAVYEADNTKKYDYEASLFNIYADKAALKVWEVLATSSREDEKWLLRTAETMFNYIDKGTQLATLSREGYENKEYLVETYGDYDNYCKITDKKRSDNIAALNILVYSAENGKPLPELYPDSARNDILDVVSSNASTVLLFCMVLAGSIVASEHMSGSIRLLVIRPRARWKILVSKLMCVVIYGLIMFAAASAVSIAAVMIISGKSDIAIPMLMYRHGAVCEVSTVIYALARTLVSALPNLLVISIAFFLSVLVKKVVFAVAIPMMINMFSSIASELVLSLNVKLPFLKWTILPYFTTNGFTMDVVTRTSGNYSFDMTSLGFELEHGLVIFLIHIAFFIALSFIVFRRQEIKN